MPKDALAQADRAHAAESGRAAMKHTKWAYTFGVIACVLPALVGLVAYLFRLSNENPTIGIVVLWVGAAPAAVLVFVSLIQLGAAAPYRPLVSRESMLWSWMNFMGRGSAGVLILVSSSLVGALLGALASSSGGDIKALFAFVAVVVFGWLAVVAVVWTARAAIDVSHVEGSREAIIGERLKTKGVRHSERKAALFALGSAVTSVVAVGAIMVALIAVVLGSVLVFIDLQAAG